MDKFGKRLGVLIKESGLTQLTISEETGINNNTISQIITGKRNPTWQQVNTFLEYFNTTTDANYFFQDALAVEENGSTYGYDAIQALDKSIQDLERLKKHLLEKQDV